jgi:hypothetical protein
VADPNAPGPTRSAEGGPPQGGDPLGGLKEVRCTNLERVEIRTRESLVTRGGWRLSASSASGDGTISLIELSPSVSLYRGDGVFLGWSADRLQAAYRMLLPRSEGQDADLPQLG